MSKQILIDYEDYLKLEEKSNNLKEIFEQLEGKVILTSETYERLNTLDMKIARISAVINEPMNNYASCIKAFDEIEVIIVGESNE